MILTTPGQCYVWMRAPWFALMGVGIAAYLTGYLMIEEMLAFLK